MTSAEQRPKVLPGIPEHILVFNGPCARYSRADEEDLSARGLPYRKEGGAVIAYDEREAPWFSIREFALPPGAGRVCPGGIAVMDFSRHYCVHVLYDFRGEDERGFLAKNGRAMATDAAVLSGYKPSGLFFHKTPYPEIVLTMLLPMSRFPGILTPAGFRQSLKIRLTKGRERARRLAGPGAGIPRL